MDELPGPGSDGAPAAGRFIGASVLRREDPRLLTGSGTFVDDVVVPGLLHVAFLRSEMARANIAGLDVSRARELAGVHAVLTAAELNDGAGPMYPTLFPLELPRAPHRPLADVD